MKEKNTSKAPVNHLIGSLAKSRKLKRVIEPGFSVINSLVKTNFAKKGSSQNKLTRNVEFAAAGAIAAYRMYNGIKKKRTHLIFQAALIGVAITGLLIASSDNKK